MYVVGPAAYIPKVNLQEVLREPFQHGEDGMTGLLKKMPGAMPVLAR